MTLGLFPDLLAEHQGDQQENDEDEEEDLCDVCEIACDVGEADPMPSVKPTK